MAENTGPKFAGKKVAEAREEVVAWLRENNLLEKEEEITQNVATAERTGGIIEPMPKLQWFIDVNKPIKDRGNMTLKEIMKDAVASNSVKILPEHFNKTYFHWIENLRDWCISRQIWYGHRIPVWYRSEEIFVGTEAPKGEDWEQDHDTLDTWFSSGLWTFSTLGWPEKTSDLKLFHPTDVLETGYEILFFWVARMILMSGYALGEVPFHTIYLHGTVRDAKGRKMSKSLGNGIDPIDVAKKFGTDAGRMALIIGNTPGTDTKISEDKIKGYKNFANKIWNITRFVLENTEGVELDLKFNDWSQNDAELRSKRDELVKEITADIDDYKLYLGAEKLYHYIWHEFADKIIEESKEIFKNGTDISKLSRKQFLLETLKTSLVLLHPFMPFVTEEIWSNVLFGKENLLIVEPWPLH
jgi:valyl-tRNA synthetase